MFVCLSQLPAPVCARSHVCTNLDGRNECAGEGHRWPHSGQGDGPERQGCRLDRRCAPSLTISHIPAYSKRTAAVLFGFSCIQHTSSGVSGLDIRSMPSKETNPSGPHAEPCRNATPPCMRLRIRRVPTAPPSVRCAVGPDRPARIVRTCEGVPFVLSQYSTVLYSTLDRPARTARTCEGVLSVLSQYSTVLYSTLDRPARIVRTCDGGTLRARRTGR